MNDLSDWIQSNWYEAGSLVAQFAIVAVLVWYGRKALEILSGSEREARVGVERGEAPSSFAAARPEPEAAGYGSVGRMLSETPEPAVQGGLAARHVERSNSWEAVVKWLRTPMKKQAVKGPQPAPDATESEPEPTPAGHGGVGRMLSPLPEVPAEQSETVAYRYVKQGGPWHAMVNWLKTPMNGRQTVAWRRVTKAVASD